MPINLNITLVQYDICWKNTNNNFKKLDLLLSPISSTDIILLPEMFNTGFCPENIDLSETMDGVTIEWMKKLSKDKRCAVAGSLMIKENDNVYNRLVWISSTGKIFKYDKSHLFSFAKEDRFIAKGKDRLILMEKGWKICPLICYDLRFPVYSRNNVDYDLLIYLANWPVKRIESWNTLLKARSIENQCYTVGVNRTGKDANEVLFNGETKVFNAFGTEIITASKGEEQVLQVVLNREDVNLKRRQMNFLKDRDKFTIH